jgi:hypothetical protein
MDQLGVPAFVAGRRRLAAAQMVVKALISARIPHLSEVGTPTIEAVTPLWRPTQAASMCHRCCFRLVPARMRIGPTNHRGTGRAEMLVAIVALIEHQRRARGSKVSSQPE